MGFLETLFGPDGPGGQPGAVGNAMNAAGGAYKKVSETPFASLLTLPTEIIRDPLQFTNSEGKLDIAALLSPNARKTFAAQKQAAQDAAKVKAIGEAYNLTKSATELFANAPTPEARAKLAEGMIGFGLSESEFNPFRQSADIGQEAARAVGREVGMMPATTALLDPAAAQQAGQTQFSTQNKMIENEQQSALTQQNQANAAALALRNMYAGQAEKQRRAIGTEKAKKRIGRRDERMRGKAFTDSVPALLAMENSPEGQAAISTNPALRNMLLVAKTFQQGQMSPQLAEEVSKGIIHAAQSGATAQGKPSDFGTTVATDSRRQEEIDNALGDVADMDWLEKNFDPAYVSIPGRGKLAVQRGLNQLGLRQDAKSFLQKRTEFFSRGQNSYLKFRKWVTGVAGEGNKELANELSIAIPDVNKDTAPDEFLAKVRATKAARAAVAQRLISLGKNIADLTPEDKASLGQAALDAVRQSDASIVDTGTTETPPIEQMDRSAKEAEVRRRLQGIK